jgi:hypothetical protein
MPRSLALFAFALGLSAQPANPGPALGAAAPDFSARDQNGRAWTRAQLNGPRGLLLVFYRSADW